MRVASTLTSTMTSPEMPCRMRSPARLSGLQTVTVMTPRGSAMTRDFAMAENGGILAIFFKQDRPPGCFRLGGFLPT